MQLQSFAHLENMVSRPTWKDILLDLISSNRLDPWNIDILELADAFISKVREMEDMDFVIQANVILAASILLKYKSNYLSILRQSDLQEFIPEDIPSDEASVEELPQLTLSARIPPKRQITIEELIGEMERIIQYDDVDRVHIPRGAIIDTIDLELGEHDIEKDMDSVLSRVREHTDVDGWSLFSKVNGDCTFKDMIYNLLCILHLVQAGTLDIRQDQMFGEIFIYLIEKEKKDSIEKNIKEENN